jgi:hypothetical protein
MRLWTRYARTGRLIDLSANRFGAIESAFGREAGGVRGGLYFFSGR